jgi:hypothetical protein
MRLRNGIGSVGFVAGTYQGPQKIIEVNKTSIASWKLKLIR